jgi:hypothetical protein
VVTLIIFSWGWQRLLLPLLPLALQTGMTMKPWCRAPAGVMCLMFSTRCRHNPDQGISRCLL